MKFPGRAAVAAMFLVCAVTQAAPQKGPESGAHRRAFARLREIFKNEPSVSEVQAAALRFYKLEPERLDSMANATRLKGLVPEVEAGMDNALGHSYSNTKDGLYPILPNPPENPNPDFYKERVSSSSDQLLWRVRAVWNLDRLVFNAEALDVRSLNSLQENLVREVTTLYFARRRLITNLVLSPPENEDDLYYDQLKLEELTATLDALTGGKFAVRAWKPDSPQP